MHINTKQRLVRATAEGLVLFGDGSSSPAVETVGRYQGRLCGAGDPAMKGRSHTCRAGEKGTESAQKGRWHEAMLKTRKKDAGTKGM